MRVGMKVVCIASDWSDWIPDSFMRAATTANPNFPGDPIVGRVYTIAHISFDDACQMCLNLEEIPDQITAEGNHHSFRYYASGFKPLEDVHNEMFRAMVHPQILAAYRRAIELFDQGQPLGPSTTKTR